MVRRLNGWQRLWGAVSVVWLLTAAAVTVAVLPKASDYGRTRLYESLEVVGYHLERENPSQRYEGAWATRARYTDLNDDELLVKLHERYKGKADFETIELKYRQQIDRLPAERTKTIGIAFLVWFIPAPTVYALGLTVVWIIRGFRQTSS